MTLTTIKKAGLDEIALDHVFTVGASGFSAYTFQGEGLNGTVNNPTLYLTRGKTYRFENGSGGHPFRIQSVSGTSGAAYNTGVTNNNTVGTVIMEVQHDAPDVLYYQCTSHAAMNGVLYITGALVDGGVTSAKIADGAIVNADINASAAIAKSKLASLDIVNADINGSAAIAGTKIDPDFGTLNITTGGNITSPVLIAQGASGSGDGIILINSGGGANNDFGRIRQVLSDDSFRIENKTSGSYVSRFTIAANGEVTIPNNLNCSAGVDVTGAVTSTTTVSDSKGNVRSIPLNSQSSAYTLVAADAGKVVYISSGGVTINENVFSAGDAVTIINNSGSNQTLTEGTGSMVLYNTADGTTGSRTLAGRGMCTLYWATTSNAYISGAGLE